MSEMPNPPKMVAVLAGKGGVGKTSLAIGLAAMLGRDQSVALVDADHQGTATRWLRRSSMSAACFRVAADPDPRGATIAAVRDALKACHLIIADGPPGSAEIIRTLAALADLVLVPTGPSTEEVYLARRVLEVVAEESEVRRSPIPTLIVPTRWDSRTTLAREALELLGTLGSPVAAPIHNRVAWQEAISAGVWLDAVGGGGAAEAEAEAVATHVREALNLSAT